jgi:hypothetical protein
MHTRPKQEELVDNVVFISDEVYTCSLSFRRILEE